MSRLAIAALPLVLLAACSSAPKRDVEVERIEASLRALDSDPSLSTLAPAERIRARQAIDALSLAGGKERQALADVAEMRVEIARAAAEAELAARQLDQLGREKDRILLEASRRDAEAARQEAERLRLQSLARAEEAQRAQAEAASAIALSELSSAEAEQARRLAQAQAEEASLARQEADLAMAAAESLRLQMQSMTARTESRGEVMTLAGDAFASGQSALLPEARANFERVVAFVQKDPTRTILIEGHTDGTGSANANQVLSQRRADAVKAALIEEGVDASRLRAAGVGEDRPVADNGSEEGRARNRRVEIILQGAGG